MQLLVDRRWMAAWVLVLALVLAGGALGQTAGTPSYDLRPQFVQGRTTRYQVWTLRQQQTTVRVGPESRSQKLRMEFNGEVTWKVERVRPEGGATCTMTLDWMTVAVTMPDGSVQRADSRQGQGQPESVHQLIRAITGVGLKAEVGADGAIRSISGTEAMARRAGEGVETPDELDFIESASDLATLPYAPAQVAVGRGWEAGFVWNHDLGKMRQVIRYQLRGVEEIEGIPVATVIGSARPKLEPDLKRLPAGGPKVDVRLLSGQVNTTVLFDLQRHEAVGRNTTETRRVEVSIRLPQQTLTRTQEETIQGQALRIGEQ